MRCISGYLHERECLAECPDGYYADKENLLCAKCMAGCEQCGNLFVCERCMESEGWVLYEGQCV